MPDPKVIPTDLSAIQSLPFSQSEETEEQRQQRETMALIKQLKDQTNALIREEQEKSRNHNL